MADDFADWEHLPHDPQAFFGLEPGFQRRDLKRAYGRLIRKYKPESHPQEFQRIRAAYEDLERAGRYGDRFEGVPEADPNRLSPEVAADVSDGGRPEGFGSSTSDLAASNPQETFKRLRDGEYRSPHDFVVLAVLSDVVCPETADSQFFDWLLQGVREHGADAGLISLLSHYLTTEVSSDEAPHILRRVADSIRGPVFYRLTEGLWVRFLREQGFEAFHELVDVCESKIVNTDPAARDTFYLCILRHALWQAPYDWSERQLATLESDAARWDRSRLEALDFLTLLLEYRRSSSLRPMTAECRCIDELLKAYCQGDGPTSLVDVIDRANQIANNAHGMRTAFPSLDCRSDVPLLLLMLHVYSDVASIVAVSSAEAENANANQAQAAAVVRDLRATMPKINNAVEWIGVRYKWLAMAAGIVATFVLCSFVLVPLAMKYPEQTLIPVGFVFVPFAFVIPFFTHLYPKFLRQRERQAIELCVARFYEKHWRARLFRYVQSCSESGDTPFERLATQARSMDEASWIRVVTRSAQNDVGLLIFAQSQQFVV